MPHYIKSLQSFFETLPNLRLAYLFGSRLDPRYVRPESDYDIALYSKNVMDAPTKLAIIDQLSELVNAPVDLVDLQNTTTVLAKEIVTTGTCLFLQNQLERDLFEARIRTQYCQLNESRKESLLNHLPAAILERI